MEEKLKGIVERVTYHNPDNGWSVLRVSSFADYGDVVTVTVHQVKVFAGATMEFFGSWVTHPRFGRQFVAKRAVEVKPASAGALEKYLGSGLIKGVGPKTARRIVKHFGADTLDVFEKDIARLKDVPGIADKKLATISNAWQEHRAIRDVMLFLQSHGVSTLFAVRIYQKYGDNSISMVSEDPYRLARDFYGIGFFSADKIALSLGFGESSVARLRAAVRHVLSAAREQGHCYLTSVQITRQVQELLQFDTPPDLDGLLAEMEGSKEVMSRDLPTEEGSFLHCYYARSLYFAEQYVASRLREMLAETEVDAARVANWLDRYGQKTGLQLSRQQRFAVEGIVSRRLAVLTGGPGCGKTTITRVVVDLLHSMGKSVLLAAPTGRAAQRMSEVIGVEAKTIHRLLEFKGIEFQRNEENPLQTDALVVDECSMLDIVLSASLLKAVAPETSVLFIGDADQLPSVGAGNVLADIINSKIVPVFHLSEIFRQGKSSAIITSAHEINRGKVPRIVSPFKEPSVWRNSDCMFIDSAEATQRELQLIRRVKAHYSTEAEREVHGADLWEGTDESTYVAEFDLPDKFSHVSVQELLAADSPVDELLAVSRKTHPWSSLYYGFTALDVVRELYTNWVPKYYPGAEIQVLSPMLRGSLGTSTLNKMLQDAVNPAADGKAELRIGEKTLRVGDRVIHRRNNYDLEVFNGDIGKIVAVDNQDFGLVVSFMPGGREVEYQREQAAELDLAYGITIHKSQGSEFEVVIIPVLTQHYKMLFRNLIYTGLTRARKCAVLVGSRRALAMAVGNLDSSERQTALAWLLVNGE